MRIRHLLAVAAIVALVPVLAPAFGDSGAQVERAAAGDRTAGKALKTAKKALKRARKAQATAKRALAGNARAWARIGLTGQVDAAKGIPSGAVTVAADGIYCFDLPFDSVNVHVTLTGTGNGGQVESVASGGVGGICGSSDSAEVLTYAANGTLAGRSFYVVMR